MVFLSSRNSGSFWNPVSNWIGKVVSTEALQQWTSLARSIASKEPRLASSGTLPWATVLKLHGNLNLPSHI